MTAHQTIAVFVPKWLYRNDVGITIFVRGLYRSIEESGRYRLLKITPRMCAFRSLDEAKAFVKKHSIALVIYHDSRVLPRNKSIEKGLDYLEACVPFLNPRSVHIADDKLETKRILRSANIPVLPETQINTREELLRSMENDALYVGKLHDAESGRGVKLIKRTATDFFEYLDGAWQRICVQNARNGIVLSNAFGWRSLIFVGLLSVIFISLIYETFPGTAHVLLGLLCVFLAISYKKKSDQECTYRPLMLEPFFGDDTEEFYCLRATVLGDKVIESAKKWNKRNVTPNISHGGTATDMPLSSEQQALAVRATKLVGATYSGVDLLFAHGKTIVCEVNVGPIGVYCEQTKVDVGGLLGEYAMRYCDERRG
jgi:predicted ATP-grasp superfamily ATP-dependent carboligase